MNDQIKVGFCVAYDWHMLKYSLPLVYGHADKICLSLDKAGISWSGNKFSFDRTAFIKFVRQLDKNNKILIVEDDYHQSGLSPMQNEVHQRNDIARHLGEGGWHIQLDCDEYFLNFESFVKYLKNLPESKTRNANVCCAWIHLYKRVQDGFLVIDPKSIVNVEFMQIATKHPFYEYGRRNGNFNIYTNFRMVHQSWARNESEIKEKIYNWGHSNDIDKESYFMLWKNLSEDNYNMIKNFHPIQPALWSALKFIKGTSISEVQNNLSSEPFPFFTRTDLFFRNSRFFARLRSLKKKVFNTK